MKLNAILCTLAATALAALVSSQAGQYTNDFSSPNLPANSQIIGGDGISSGVISNGVLVLTVNSTNQSAAFAVSDLDAGSTVGSMTARFKVRMGGGSNPPADGWSFNWGPDVNGLGANSFEEGEGSGLTVEFDLYDNGGGEAPAIDLKWGGNEFAHTPTAAGSVGAGIQMETGTNFADVFIQVTSNGVANIAFNGQTIYTNVVIDGFTPFSGGGFSIKARTGGSYENQWFDNINIATTVAGATGTAPTILNSGSFTNLTGFGSQSLNFNVLPQGTPPFTFQWFTNGVAVGSGTMSQFSLKNLATNLNGTKIKVTVSNGSGSVTSPEFTLAVQPAVLAPGFLFDQVYLGITGTAVSDLTSSPNYPDNPDLSGFLAGFDTRSFFPTDIHDNYGAQITGFVIPPSSGNWTFFLKSDDSSQLFLSTSADPAALSASPIAEEPGCCNPFLERTNTDGSMNTQTSDPIPLVGGQMYYVKALLKEGGGGDFLQVAWRKQGDTTPAASLTPIPSSGVATYAPPIGTVSITSQPTNTTAVLGTMASFSLSVTSSPSTTLLQWYRNGVPIPGANSSTFSIPSVSSTNNNDKFSVTIRAPGSEVVTSSVVTLTVSGDPTLPHLLSTGGLMHHGTVEIDLVFDKPLSASATTLANFKLGTGAISAARYLTNAGGLSNRQSAIVLTATGLSAGSTTAIGVSNIVDTVGNTIIATNGTVTISKMTWASIGKVDPALGTPDAVAVGTNGFNLLSGGNAFWGTEDDITFVYEQITGDFDKVAQFEYVDPASNWARAGLEARETLNEDQDTTVTNTATGLAIASRYQNVQTEPAIKFDGTVGNNGFETNRRLDTGAQTTGAGTGGTPNYPNSWVRLQRQGDVMSMFYSNDGQTWNSLGQTDFSSLSGDGSLPQTMYVGLVYGPENGNITDATKKGRFAVRARNYGDFSTNAPPPQLTISKSANNITLSWGSGGGELQSTPSLNPPITWSNVSSNSPATVPLLTTTNRFFRVLK